MKSSSTGRTLLRRASRPVLVLALLVSTTTTATTASAQVVEAPERITLPPRTEGTIRTLQLDTSLFGGYDRNEVPADPQQGPPVTFVPNTLTSWGSATLQYSVVNGGNAFDAGGGATLNTNNNQRNSGPVYGTHANVGFRTSMGRERATFSFSNFASRAPYYTMGLFGGLPPGAYSPDTNPINGIVDGYLWSLNSSASLRYSMTRRTSADVTYAFLRSLHEGGISSDMSVADHSATGTVAHLINRTTGIRGSYRIAKQRSTHADLRYDGHTHAFTFGFTLSQPLGRTRTLQFNAGGGADQIDVGGTNRYWQPTYFAMFATDIGRSWVVSANYTQMTAVLYSPLSAPDSYLSRSFLVSVGGDLLSNLELVLNAGASQGDVSATQSITGSPGSYLGVNLGAQVTAQLSGSWAAVVGTNYFRSELSGAAGQFQFASGFFQRASLRGGLTWNVPLLGGRTARSPRE